MYIAILGRQPTLGMAELERLYGSQAVSWYSDTVACINTEQFDFERLGGSQKAGRVVLAEQSMSWNILSKKIIRYYHDLWKNTDHKITLGISVYGLKVSTRDIQQTGLTLKKQLRSRDVSLRLIPNTSPAHNTAVSHHNKLGLSPHKVELLIVAGHNGQVLVAESIGAQNITALAARDQARPRTDAFVGMLPPKLARIMINLATGDRAPRILPANQQPGEHSDFPSEVGQDKLATSDRPYARRVMGGGEDDATNIILDPFCGTGVVLQEAALLGYNAYGTDLSEKMVAYSRENLDWLTQKYHLSSHITIDQGDAMTTTWQPPIHTVVCETYLGQPFSAPPSPAKLAEVRGNCNHIVSAFLTNIAPQLASGTSLCLAVPAWSDGHGRFTHLPLTRTLDRLGYHQTPLTHADTEKLLYYREGQVVARELLLLTKS